MPKCKNDPKKSYKGTEPSPKGLGFCAHSEKLGTVRKGLDNNTWKIEANIKGVKRWVKQKSKSFKKNTSENIIKNNKIKYKDYYIYSGYDGNLGFTPVNYFVCIVPTKKAIIYQIPKNFYSNIIVNDNKHEDYKDFFLYSNLRKKYNHYFSKIIIEFTFDKIFVAKGIDGSLLNKKIYYNRKYDGNNLLFKLNKDYIFVGNQIYKFNTDNDEIIDFYSSIELYNHQHCPVAYGKKYAYFLLYKKKVSLEYFHHFNLKNKINPLYYYTVSSYTKTPSKEEQDKKRKQKLNGKPLEKYSIPLKIIKI